MKIISKPKGGGKTTYLIKESAETGAYIVCANFGTVHKIQREALKMELKIPQPVTFAEFLDGQYYPKGIKGFLIDDAESLLQRLSNVKILTITVTSDEK